MTRKEGIYIHEKKVRDLTKVEELQIDLFCLKEEKENLIKYLENCLKANEHLLNRSEVSSFDYFLKLARKDQITKILEKVRSGKYD